ncbi:protein-S-isoprenylcysteine O-methyltransferase isoform X2 [Bemisia tabaci]|uniref:protein-S-isoprenylcysteine O-methyltransferase isoform X2 n=1 Tax=Bemisia tabaci TaxID=7038 RepID=UPI003B28A4EC
MLPYPGRLSVFCFCTSSSFAFILFLQLIPIHSRFNVYENILWVFPLYYLILNLVLMIFLRGFALQIAIRASFLGMIFAAGIFIQLLATSTLQPFGWYMCFMSFFHFSEFLAIAATDHGNLSVKSFILNHSPAYNIAAVTSWVEFFTEWYFWPGLKLIRSASYIGILMCIGGEALRKAAIFTAAKNFNHIIQSEKKDDHVLVTHGVYSLCRHPSYVGWFYWSIGTQFQNSSAIFRRGMN